MSNQASPYLSAAELAWLRLPDEGGPAATTVVLTFARSLDPPCLKARIEDRLMASSRFRQRPDASRLPLARPRWRDHDEFDLSQHLIYETSDTSGSSPSLATAVGRVLQRPLGGSRPLWQVHVLDLLEQGTVVVARVHQAIADPTVVPRLVLRLADTETNANAPDPAPDRLSTLGWQHLVSTSEILEAAREGAAHTRMLCRLIASRSDHDNPLRRHGATNGGVAWSSPLALQTVRAGARRRQVGVNELVLCAVAGGLRQELHRRDTPVADVTLRAVLPIDLRQPGDGSLGTRLALALLSLPIQFVSAEDRLAQTQREVARLARSADKLTALGLQPRRGLSMSEIEERCLRLLGHKATLMVSAFQGPESSLRACGEPLTGIMQWPALCGDLGLGISAVAYSGQLRFGVLTKDSDLDSASRLAEGLSRSLDRLL